RPSATSAGSAETPVAIPEPAGELRIVASAPTTDAAGEGLLVKAAPAVGGHAPRRLEREDATASRAASTQALPTTRPPRAATAGSSSPATTPHHRISVSTRQPVTVRLRPVATPPFREPVSERWATIRSGPVPARARTADQSRRRGPVEPRGHAVVTRAAPLALLLVSLAGVALL